MQQYLLTQCVLDKWRDLFSSGDTDLVTLNVVVWILCAVVDAKAGIPGHA